MIVCNGSTKAGTRVQRHRMAVQLEPALVELIKLYEALGGPAPEVGRLIDGEIERCLEDSGGGRDRAQSHLYRMLRARDLHGYVMEEPELTPVKVMLLEHLAFHREPWERWAAARALLVEHLDAICRTPLPGLSANLELYKRELSDRGGRLGRLLLTVALFNLDGDEEMPPANVMLQFRRGRFPEHTWALLGPDGRTLHHAAPGAWSPANPLCRWEYLAMDLAHALYRRQRGAPRTAPEAGWGAGGGPAEQDTVTQLYCRLEPEAEAGGPAQMELLPTDPPALRAELLRLVHRRHGPDGVRLLAVLLERLAAARPGAVVELALGELAAAGALGDTTARGTRTRLQRLERVIERLSRVELTRIRTREGRSAAERSPLLAVLGRTGDWPPAGGEPAAEAIPPGSTALRVLADPFLVESRALAPAFRDLPAFVLERPAKEQPYALALCVYLREAWRAEGAGTVERPARELLHDAGLWVSETGRYRAMEALKRDLHTLQQQGCLGAWRVQRSPARDALEERYVLTAPGPRPAQAVRPVAVPAGPGAALGGSG